MHINKSGMAKWEMESYIHGYHIDQLVSLLIDLQLSTCAHKAAIQFSE